MSIGIKCHLWEDGVVTEYGCARSDRANKNFKEGRFLTLEQCRQLFDAGGNYRSYVISGVVYEVMSSPPPNFEKLMGEE